MTVDIERLRSDLKSDRLGAYFGGGFGAAIMEIPDIERATPEKLIDMAQKQGIDLNKYIKRGY